MSARLEAALAELAAAIREEVRAEVARDGGPVELLDVGTAARRSGIGRTLMYRLIADGTVRSVKVSRRRLIPADALAALATNEGATATNGSALEADRASDRPRRSAA